MGASGGPKLNTKKLKLSIDPTDETQYTSQHRLKNFGELDITGSLYSGVYLNQVSASTHYVDCGTHTGDALGDNYDGGLTFTGWYYDERPTGGAGYGEGQSTVALLNIGHKDASEHGRFMFSLVQSSEHSHHQAVMMIGNNGKNIVHTMTSAEQHVYREKWTHYACVYNPDDSATTSFTSTNGSGARIYINGEPVTTTAAAGAFPATSTMDMAGRNTSFGAYYSAAGGGNYNIEGGVSDFRLYNTHLNEDQIKDIYNNAKLLPSGISGSNLVGYWPMCEGKGDVVYDGSGNQATGSLKNSPQFLSGSSAYNTNHHAGGFIPQLSRHGYNRKMHFSMDSGFVRVPNDDDLNPGTGDFSFMLWWNGESGANELLFKAYPKGYRLVSASGRYRFSVFEAWFSEGNYASIDFAKIPDVWNCIVVSCDRSGDVNCYVNGAIKATTDLSFMPDDVSETGQDMYIGAVLPTLSQDRPTAGIIDEVCFWKSALSTAEVQSLYQTGSFGRPNPPDARTIGSNLTMYLRNGGTQTGDWVDLSGNGNDGVVSQSAAGARETLHIINEYDGEKRDANGFPMNGEIREGAFNLNRMSGSHSALKPNTGMQYVKISPGNSNTLHHDMTYSLWYKREAETTVGANRILNVAAYANSSNFFEHIVTDPYYGSDGSTEVWAFSSAGGGRRDLSGTYAPSVKGQWRNLILSFNSGSFDHYLDGQFQKTGIFAYSGSAWNENGTTQTPIYLGAGNNYHYYNADAFKFADCTIGKFDIWHFPFTKNDVIQHWNQFKSRFGL